MDRRSFIRASVITTVAFKMGVAAAAPASAVSNPAVYLFAHPDDEVIAAGGDIATHVAAGQHVILVTMTRGEGTGASCSMGIRPAEAGRRRVQEIRDVGAYLGVQEVIAPGEGDMSFVGGYDGALRTERVRQAIEWLVERHGSIRLKTHSPWDRYSSWPEGGHMDHRAVSEATMQAHADGLVTDVRMWRLGHIVEPERNSDVSAVRPLSDHQPVKSAAVDIYMEGVAGFSTPAMLTEARTADEGVDSL